MTVLIVFHVHTLVLTKLKSAVRDGYGRLCIKAPLLLVASISVFTGIPQVTRFPFGPVVMWLR